MRTPPPSLAAFPAVTHEKLRYADTDRQGHVNNAVFAVLLEAGRVELLCAPPAPVFEPGCAFVLARLQLDFRAELSWPGQVDVGTRVADVGTSSVTLEQALFQAGRCAAVATTVVVQVSEATGRPQPLTEVARERLARWTGPRP
ncbi:MAG: acyl-CoA thioesterase [Myxococcaceae bacterium]|nr:acyl-CoA thioesterase [Myxococcaceae bacterium]MCA3015270.1 acyl-CoA thioesterase [Myxococcaceae bacterium]